MDFDRPLTLQVRYGKALFKTCMSVCVYVRVRTHIHTQARGFILEILEVKEK